MKHRYDDGTSRQYFSRILIQKADRQAAQNIINYEESLIMDYSFSPRDKVNRATPTINERKVGRIHFRDGDAWLNPYRSIRLKNRSELEALDLKVEINPDNKAFQVKVFTGTCNEEGIARTLEYAFLD